MNLMDEVAELLEMPKVSVCGDTFYSMLETTPCGRNNVAIYTNISCMLRGSDDIVKHVKESLGLIGQSTEDGNLLKRRMSGSVLWSSHDACESYLPRESYDKKS